MRLNLLSCTYHWSLDLPYDHLQVLCIDNIDVSQPVFPSFRRFTSLTELWIPVEALVEEVVIQGTQFADVFPPALEILVIFEDHDTDQIRDCWDFRTLTNLRSLGLTYRNLRIEPCKLPSQLHTIAVHPSLVSDLRESLGEAKSMTRVATMTDDYWSQGPSKGGFLPLYSEEEDNSSSLRSLQKRQRERDGWHYQLRVWGVDTEHSENAITRG